MGEGKRLRKKIAGEERVIAEHRQRIRDELARPLPDRRGVAKWEQDIARHERILAGLRARLERR